MDIRASDKVRTFNYAWLHPSIPAGQWDTIPELGFDAVWFMGVWERSPIGIAIADRNDQLLQDFRRALPDFSPDDNVGSPYCVRQYSVDPLWYKKPLTSFGLTNQAGHDRVSVPGQIPVPTNFSQK